MHIVSDDKITEYKYWDEPENLDDDGVRDSDLFKFNNVIICRKGTTYPMFNRKIREEVSEKLSDDSKHMYEKLGVYRFRPHELVESRLDGRELLPGLIITDNEGAQYIGEITGDSIKHGRGVAIYADGSLYEGFFKNNQRHGSGRFIYANGDVYMGTFINGLCEGYGLYDALEDTDFKGYWSDGKMHGRGFEIEHGEYTFRGKFKNGEK
jgi:hypothetical protein